MSDDIISLVRFGAEGYPPNGWIAKGSDLCKVNDVHYRLVVQERNNSRAVECYSINGLKWAPIYYHSRLVVSTQKCNNTHSLTTGNINQ